MAYDHLTIHPETLRQLALTANMVGGNVAHLISGHFQQLQAAHETNSPLDLLQQVRAACKEILSDLENCPVKMTAKRLEHILAAAAGDLELAAEMINEQVFEALNK